MLQKVVMDLNQKPTKLFHWRKVARSVFDEVKSEGEEAEDV